MRLSSGRFLIPAVIFVVVSLLVPIANAGPLPPVGAQLVKDINPSGSSHPRMLGRLGSDVLFSANNGSGRALWVTDGTPTGTQLVDGVSPAQWGKTFGGYVYFPVEDPPGTFELWRSDGTFNGTTAVTNTAMSLTNDFHIDVGTYPVRLGTHLLFAAGYGSTEGAVWRTDGTPSGTHLVKEPNPGAASGLGAWGFWSEYQGSWYFGARVGTHGTELWRTDGTTSGTKMVVDADPGASSLDPTSMSVANGFLMFIGHDAAHGWELWRSDGTPAGTHIVRDIDPGPSDSYPYGFEYAMYSMKDRVFFYATDVVHGYQLWRSDGTKAHTKPITAIANGFGYDALYLDDVLRQPASCSSVCGPRLFFEGDDGVHGNEYWVSDGTSAGTKLLKDINPSTGYSDLWYISNAAAAPGSSRRAYFFMANDGTHGFELWRADGASGNTSMVADINPTGDGLDSTNGCCGMTAGSTLFFEANDGSTGYELYKTIVPTT